MGTYYATVERQKRAVEIRTILNTTLYSHLSSRVVYTRNSVAPPTPDDDPARAELRHENVIWP